MTKCTIKRFIVYWMSATDEMIKPYELTRIDAQIDARIENKLFRLEDIINILLISYDSWFVFSTLFCHTRPFSTDPEYVHIVSIAILSLNAIIIIITWNSLPTYFPISIIWFHAGAAFLISEQQILICHNRQNVDDVGRRQFISTNCVSYIYVHDRWSNYTEFLNTIYNWWYDDF